MADQSFIDKLKMLLSSPGTVSGAGSAPGSAMDAMAPAPMPSPMPQTGPDEAMALAMKLMKQREVAKRLLPEQSWNK